MKKIIPAFILMIFIAAPVFCEDLSFEFHKELFDGERTDIAGGFIYIKNFDSEEADKKAFYFHVTYPVNQVITYDRDSMIIFYPEEDKAFIIASKEGKKGLDMGVTDVTAKKLDLKALGFTVAKTSREGASIVEKWVPGKAQLALVKEITVVKGKGARLEKMEMVSRKGEIIMRVINGDYFEVEGKQVPGYTESYSGLGKYPITEKMRMKNMTRSAKLPPLFADFKIPETAQVERVEK